jgi:anti-anti-sigma factor
MNAPRALLARDEWTRKERVNALGRVSGMASGFTRVILFPRTWLPGMTTPMQSDLSIPIERHGSIAVVFPSPEAAALLEQPLEQAAISALAPIGGMPPTGIVMDLTRMDYFGSRFIGFLIRCHKLIKNSGGQMVVAGASGRIRELLRLSALDRVWPFYEDRAKAVQALTATGKV